jgi:hypothetical protein
VKKITILTIYIEREYAPEDTIWTRPTDSLLDRKDLTTYELSCCATIHHMDRSATGWIIHAP